MHITVARAAKIWIRRAAEALWLSMGRIIAPTFRALLVTVTALSGCDKLGLSGKPQPSTQRPSPTELERIRYMSQAGSRDGRRIFDHLEQAKSCRDLELAMRWNRPSDVEGGPFNKKLIYLSRSMPADLPRQSEVFVSGRIERGESLPSGAWGWSLEMTDGSEVQAIETADYWEKQQQAQQDGIAVALVKPSAPGRKLCIHGVYQGLIGKSPKRGGNIPLVSVLFALDRGK
jgi:hypothetical protein